MEGSLMKKKWIAPALLIFLLFLPGWALGEEEITVAPGEEITLSFSVTANPNSAVAATALLEYDHNAFELIPSGFIQKDRAFLMDINGIPEGQSYEVTLRALPNAGEGDYNIGFAVEEAGDINETFVSGFALSSLRVRIALPEPEKEREFSIHTGVLVERGRVTVSWTDSLDAAPYEVNYQYVGGTAVQSTLGAGAESSVTYDQSFTFDFLIPGNTYLIYVKDKDGNTISQTVTVPFQGTFREGNLLASSIGMRVFPRRMKAGEENAEDLPFLSAPDMEEGIRSSSADYGIGFEVSVPAVESERTYFWQMGLYSSDGYHLVVIGNQPLEQSTGPKTYPWSLIGQWFFQYMYQQNNRIPSGSYKAELFWDGMLVATNYFDVSPERGPTSTPKPTATPKATATPKPTATPAPRREFSIVPSVNASNGQVTVHWVDTDNAGPYRVSFRYVGGTAAQCGYWAGGDQPSSTVTEKSFTFTRLISGYTYEITVRDRNDVAVTQEITVPAAGKYESTKLRLSALSVQISPKYQNKQDLIFNLNSFRANDIEKYSADETRFYGIRYEINIPQLSSKLNVMEQVVAVGPTGYCETLFAGPQQYENTDSARKYYWDCLGRYYFINMYSSNSAVARGKYRVELYWDGKLVNTSYFDVE